VRNQINLFAGNSKYIYQDARGKIAHHDETIGASGNLLHDGSLVGIWGAKNSMERSHDRHCELLQQLEYMAARIPAKYPVLVLQAH
jgi:hypothetical protein